MNPALEKNVPLLSGFLRSSAARSRGVNLRGLGKVGLGKVLENSRIFRPQISSIIFLMTKVSATAGSKKEKSDEYIQSELPLFSFAQEWPGGWQHRLISHGHLTAGGPVNFPGYIAGFIAG